MGRICPRLPPSWVNALEKKSLWPSHGGSWVPLFLGPQQTRFLLVSFVFAATEMNGLLLFFFFNE